MGPQHAISKYMEHGECFLWEPGLVWLHVISDIITGIAYYSIPFGMFYFAYKRRDLPFHFVFLLFGIFIMACGTTHFLAVYTIYVPEYWVEGGVKAFTALISAVSAFYFIPLIPKAIAMPSLTKSLEENQELNAQLEKRLSELNAKTQELMETNRELNLSENRFRVLIEHAPDAIVVYDVAQDRFVDANANAERLFGCSREEILASGPKRFYSSSQPDGLPLADSMKESIGRAMAGETLLFERAVHNVEGKDLLCELRLALLPFTDRTLIRGSFIDITERKRAEVELKKSEETFRSLVNNIPGIVYRGHRDWSLSFMGAEVESVTGYTRDEFTSGAVRWQEIIYPDDLERVKETFRKVATEKLGHLRVEYRIRHKNGGIRWIADRRQMVYDGDGAFAHVDGLLLDVTAKKEADRRLEESEYRFRAIADTATDGIVTADAQGRIIFFNQAAERAFGHVFADVAGKNIAMLMPERHRSAHQGGMDRFLKTKTPGIIGKTVELEGLRKEGAEFPIELSLSTWESKEGTVFSAIIRDITERKKREEELTRLHMAVDQSAEAVVVTDPKGTIEYVNPAFERITGYSREETTGRNMRILKSGKQDEMFYRNVWETILRGEVWRGRFINRKKDGRLYEEEAVISPVRNASGKIIRFVAGKRDITRDVVLQKQVETAQRMESVGTLAGGIAHDFNNALTGIMGFGELMRLRLAGDSKSAADLDEMMRCAERAATLTRQLLTFARRQVIEPVNLSLNAVVVDLMKLISKVAGEHIEVKTVLAKDLKTVYADQAQIEQVLMNLCLNARDAMPEGGTLLVETEDVIFREEDIGLYSYLKVGRYAALKVSDTGIGMDEKTRERVFEPFFTTKGPDKGTGLGLAMVYGIVKQHNGFIHVESKLGNGATFKAYFPAVEMSPDAVARKRQEEGLKGGTETILLAEDEETIRSLSERVLKEFGYTVLVARNGEEAIEAFRMNKGISLAVLDVVMPKTGGMEAFKEMQGERPGLKAVFTSGYSAEAIHESFMLAPGVQFLPKPYTPSVLVRKVRDVLDSA